MRALVPAAALLLMLGLGCDERRGATPPEGDADTDTDADGDADADGDVDADSDADTDLTLGPCREEEGAPPCLQDEASAVFVGAQEQDHAGAAVAGGGDVDGDGLDDFLILSSGADPSAVATLFSGTPSGPTPLGNARATFMGVSGVSRVGYPLFLLDDSNGDAYADLLLGDEGQPYYLFHGPVSGDLSLDDADAVLFYTTEEYIVAVPRDAIDMDGSGTVDVLLDGWEELYLVATPFSGSGSGFASSVAWATLDVPEPSLYDPCNTLYEYARAGDSALVGDLDGDGFGDVAVGNYHWHAGWWTDPEKTCLQQMGVLYVTHGPLSGTVDLDVAAVAITGEEGGTNPLGQKLSGAGDMNGDGLQDLFAFAGALDDNDEAESFVLFGPVTTGGTITDLADKATIVPNGYVAYEATPAGDVDADGFDDLIVFAFGEDFEVYAVLQGPLSGTLELEEAPLIWRGRNRNDAYVAAMAGAGDVDGDGLGDLLFGAYQANDEERGEAYLFYGADL